MELRVLEYFLAIAREQNISAAGRISSSVPANPFTTDERAGGKSGESVIYPR